ncbi:hypothetical protein R3P38DRAFT_3453672 [Favolaschia claudopus]|uniref:Uncharacterized protein n=1 Tax=Favolaschia claudopus TaxID=2862362 RepID=A0AAW0CQK8_9AGAR
MADPRRQGCRRQIDQNRPNLVDFGPTLADLAGSDVHTASTALRGQCSRAPDLVVALDPLARLEEAPLARKAPDPSLCTMARYLRAIPLLPFLRKVALNILAMDFRRPSSSLNTPVPPNRTYHHASSHNIVNHYNYNSASLDTPTQSNAYQNHPHHQPQPIPFALAQLPSAPSQMDQLMGMMAQLMNNQNQMLSRITALETTKPQRSRGLPALRGRKATGRSKARKGAAPPPSDADDDDGDQQLDPSLRATSDTYSADNDDTACSDDDTDADECNEEHDSPESNLRPAEVSALQRLTTKTARNVTGIQAHNWPDPSAIRINPETQQAYPTPLFVCDASHHRNQRVIQAVTDQVIHDLKTQSAWPKALQRPRDQPPPTWNRSTIRGFAVNSFNTLKRSWKDDQAHLQSGSEADNPRADDRRHKRRKRKSERLIKIAPAFAEKFGLDPDFVIDVLFEQYLSDELSGPDLDSQESKEAWKVRIASAIDFPLDPKSLASKHFLEVTVPCWRASRYSAFIREVEDFLELNPIGDAAGLKYERVRTGRISDRLPNIAPYNFGISQSWFDAHRKLSDYRNRLRGWGEFAEPDDCGIEDWVPIER